MIVQKNYLFPGILKLKTNAIIKDMGDFLIGGNQ